MNFLFTCGGTAGHIYPAVGVAQRLRELMPDCGVLFVGSKGHMETELVPREGFPIKTVEITNISREVSLDGLKHNAKTAKNVVRSTAEAKKLVREFAPDCVIGTGGYVCYPVIRAAHSLGVPTLVHESNAVPGLTTKMLSGMVDRIMVGFEESRANYRHPDKVVVTGTPVRGDFKPSDRREAKKALGLDPEKPLVLSVWGSLGSDRMNEVMVSLIEKSLASPFFNLIHATGRGGYAKMTGAMDKYGRERAAAAGMEVREYIYNMPQVMAAADLVLCRSGASTLSELAVMGKPALLIPSPNVTNNHQEKNARVLEKAGAAVVMPESEVTDDKLLGAISTLLQNPETLDAMSIHMGEMGVTDATERITEMVLSLIKDK